MPFAQDLMLSTTSANR